MANARGSIDMKGIAAASKQATNYISYDSTGIMISDLDGNYQTPSTATERNVFIDSTSVNVRDGQTNLATFSDAGVVVGETDKANIELTSSEIVATTDNGVEFFHIKSGEYSGSSEYQNSVEVENTYGTSQNFYGEAKIAEDLEYNTTVNFVVNITYSGASTSNTVTTEESYEYVSDEDATPIMFGTVDFYNLGITVNMWTSSQKTIYINIESETYTIANVVVDYTVTLSEYQAVSYTFGSRGINSDVGNKSFVCGDYLIASSANQFVVGRYNVEDAAGTYAFIVGNGRDVADSRSNAFAVKWGGDVETNTITLNENSLSEADNYIECVDVNDTSVFKVVKSSGNTIVSGALIANSTATFNSNVITRGDLDVGDALTVGGALTAAGELNNGTVPIFKTAEISFNCGTINANSAWSQTGYGISHSNYRAIAIAGFKVTNDDGWCVVPKIYIHNTSSGDTLDVYIWNQKTSQITNIYLKIKILYIASTALDTSYLQA